MNADELLANHAKHGEQTIACPETVEGMMTQVLEVVLPLLSPEQQAELEALGKAVCEGRVFREERGFEELPIKLTVEERAEQADIVLKAIEAEIQEKDRFALVRDAHRQALKEIGIDRKDAQRAYIGGYQYRSVKCVRVVCLETNKTWFEYRGEHYDEGVPTDLDRKKYLQLPLESKMGVDPATAQPEQKNAQENPEAGAAVEPESSAEAPPPGASEGEPLGSAGPPAKRAKRPRALNGIVAEALGTLTKCQASHPEGETSGPGNDQERARDLQTVMASEKKRGKKDHTV